MILMHFYDIGLKDMYQRKFNVYFFKLILKKIAYKKHGAFSIHQFSNKIVGTDISDIVSIIYSNLTMSINNN